MSHRSTFERFSTSTARHTGQPGAFIAAAGLIVLWLVTGPMFKFSDTWQLIINTTTTIVTFLMVFLIQSTQNRDSEAMQLKLNEIIRALEGAHVSMMDLEDLTVEELDAIRANHVKLAEEAREARRKGLSDTGAPEEDFVDDPETSGKSRRGRPRKPSTD